MRVWAKTGARRRGARWCGARWYGANLPGRATRGARSSMGGAPTVSRTVRRRPANGACRLPQAAALAAKSTMFACGMHMVDARLCMRD
eukprot:337750-Chlamydomonas_euryale.AAC.1